jgi:hypothetical protein
MLNYVSCLSTTQYILVQFCCIAVFFLHILLFHEACISKHGSPVAVHIGIIFYNKLSWFVPELPEKDIFNVVIQSR